MFDSLKFANRLEGVGLTREQAETHVQIMTELMETNLATKGDLKDAMRDLRTELKQEIEELRTEMKLGTKDLINRMDQLEYRMTIRTGTIVCLALSAFVALSRLGLLGPHV